MERPALTAEHVGGYGEPDGRRRRRLVVYRYSVPLLPGTCQAKLINETQAINALLCSK